MWEDIEDKYEKALNNLVIFPGSIEEYKEFSRLGGLLQVIDTMKQDKGLILKNTIPPQYVNYRNRFHPLDEELFKYLVDNGIEAIVNARYEHTDTVYGLPVRRRINVIPKVVPPSSLENEESIKRKGELRAL